MDSLQAKQAALSVSTKEQIDRIYDFSKWFLGLMITLAIGLVTMGFVRKTKSDTLTRLLQRSAKSARPLKSSVRHINHHMNSKQLQAPKISRSGRDLFKIISESILRAGIKSIPIIGEGIDQATFGVKDAISNEEYSGHRDDPLTFKLNAL